MSNPVEKPLPQVTPLTAPFWDAARDGRLVMQKCQVCGAFVWTPRAHCYECGGEELTWTELSGRGSVHTFTVIRQVAGRGSSPAFQADIPYMVALIDLVEGPRMLSNIIDCAVDDVRIDMPVTVVFSQASPEIWLPKFTPI